MRGTGVRADQGHHRAMLSSPTPEAVPAIDRRELNRFPAFLSWGQVRCRGAEGHALPAPSEQPRLVTAIAHQFTDRHVRRVRTRAA
jgi:hypothetical protein